MLRKEDLFIRSIYLKRDLKDKGHIEETLNSSLNWDYIFNQAGENNVFPLLYKTLLNIKNIEKEGEFRSQLITWLNEIYLRKNKKK